MGTLALPTAYLAANGWVLEWHGPSLWYAVAYPGAFILAMMLVVTPYRMWAAQRREIASLKNRLESGRPNRDAWLSDAVFYGVNKVWPTAGERLFDGNDTRQQLETNETWNAAVIVVRNLRQAARDAFIHVWGIEKPDTVLLGAEDWAKRTIEPISPDHWKQYEVDPYLLNFSPEMIWTQRSSNDFVDDGSYCALRVNKSEIESALAKDCQRWAREPHVRRLSPQIGSGIRGDLIRCTSGSQVPLAVNDSWPKAEENS